MKLLIKKYLNRFQINEQKWKNIDIYYVILDEMTSLEYAEKFKQ